MNWIKSLFVSAMLTLSRYMPNQEYAQPQETIQPQVEPEKEMDEWNQWLHHDDVSKEEIDMLYSGDPEQMKMAQEAIRVRQEEFQNFWNDPELRKEVFWGGEMPEVDLNREQRPMHEREGWEDDDDMPETFIGINEVTGELEEIRFDELEEWQNEPNGSELLASEMPGDRGEAGPDEEGSPCPEETLSQPQLQES